MELEWCQFDSHWTNRLGRHGVPKEVGEEHGGENDSVAAGGDYGQPVVVSDPIIRPGYQRPSRVFKPGSGDDQYNQSQELGIGHTSLVLG